MTKRRTTGEDRPSEILGALPNARPQRRSDKRRAGAGAQGGEQAEQPAGQAKQPTAPAGQGTKPAKQAARRSARSASRARQRTGAAADGPAAASAPVAPRTPRRPPRTKPDPLPQPAQPRGVPPAPARRGAEGDEHAGVIGSAVQAAAELTEFGLGTTARVLRGALKRLPKR